MKLNGRPEYLKMALGEERLGFLRMVWFMVLLGYKLDLNDKFLR